MNDNFSDKLLEAETEILFKYKEAVEVLGRALRWWIKVDKLSKTSIDPYILTCNKMALQNAMDAVNLNDIATRTINNEKGE